MEKEKSLVSVLMTAYNEKEEHFREAIESVLNQSYVNFEVVLLIDNPDSRPLIRLASRYEQEDSRLRVFVNESNIGLVHSLNKGLKQVRGDYICRMDSDDVSHKDRIVKQLSFLTLGDYDLVGCSVDVIDEDGAHLYKTGNLPQTPEEVNRALRWNNCVPHPTWFGKKEIFSQGYRSVPLCEDYDFLLRAAINGFKLANCSESLLSYRMSSDSISRNNLFEQYLSQCFLSKEYKKKKIADLKEVDIRVKKGMDRKKADRYVKANRLFNQSMSLLSKKKYLSGMRHLIVIPSVSISFLNKMRRMFISRII